MFYRLQATLRVMGALALLMSALVLGGCSTRSGAGETAAQAGPSAAQASAPAPPLLLDLPALVISYDAAGVPSIGDSTPLADLQTLLPPALISQLTLDAATIQAATGAGIQHLMLSNTPSGLRILVNGQPLPALVWDTQSLDNLLTLLGQAEGSPPVLRELAVALRDLGIGLVVQLPSGDGAPALPLLAQGEQSNAARAQAGRETFLAGAGAPVIRIPVDYAETGAWSVHGLTDTQWQALTGLPFGYVRLNPDLLAAAAAAGIRQVVVWTDADGIHLTIGDKELPYLRWADGGIYTLVDLLLRLGVVEVAADDRILIGQLLDQWLPALQATDLRIVVNFPSP